MALDRTRIHTHRLAQFDDGGFTFDQNCQDILFLGVKHHGHGSGILENQLRWDIIG